MLKEALEKWHPEYEVLVLCRTLEGGLSKKIGYLFHMLGPQMRALATSKVAVLDSYCIAVSILPHKKHLKVIQMWHAMGALKKFGRSILDQEEGSSESLAKSMNMHKGYDFILASSDECAGYFQEAFGYGEDHFVILPLPRADLLTDYHYQKDKRQEILAAYPALRHKKVVLYAPTFRKAGAEEEIAHLKELALGLAAHPDYQLVWKAHPLTADKAPKDLFADRKFTSLEWLSVADWFITDYSAMIFEAALAEKDMSLFAYDLDTYVDKRGFYVDYERDMPVAPLTTAEEVVSQILAAEDQSEARHAFLRRFVTDSRHNTQSLVNLIESQMKEWDQ